MNELTTKRQAIVAKLNRQHRAECAAKKMLLLVISVLLLSTAVAQNEGQYTHFMFNRLSYNPAYAGSSGNISATALYRNQWVGLSLQAPVAGAESGSTPTNILFSFDMPVRWLHGGIGMNFNSEEIGYRKTTSIDLDYAFRIFWGPGTLAAGIEVDLQNYTLDTKNLRGADDYDGMPGSGGGASNDPLLGQQDASDFLIDLSAGLFYQVPGVYYVGVSMKNLLAAHSDNLNCSNTRTLYLMGGYEYVFPYNPSFRIKPSAMAKVGDFSVAQIDLACLLDYENIFWTGLSYRWRDAACLLAGVNFAKVMKVGVAYDMPLSKLGLRSGRNFGSLELFVNAAFQITMSKKSPTVSGNTLYLR